MKDGYRIGTASTVVLVVGLSLALASCSPKSPVVESDPVQRPTPRETPAPDSDFREHRLARCTEDLNVSRAVERYLGTCSEYFRDGSGSDGMIEMEMGLEAGHRHSLMFLTLGQLYLLAGQGNPDLLPVEGPAADQGSYDLNKPRLLNRARDLLKRALIERPDDAAVDYLLADVARTAGETENAAALVARGTKKCTGGRSFRILQMYQELYRHPPRYLGGPGPVFPQTAINNGYGGEVVLDLLLSPAGEVRQFEVVRSPAESLTKSAQESLQEGRFEPARIGKYGVWAWLRVTTAFTLDP